jgi:murein DD-endopeptidase MepM/ murein hydrolase activator NlpD
MKSQGLFSRKKNRSYAVSVDVAILKEWKNRGNFWLRYSLLALALAMSFLAGRLSIEAGVPFSIFSFWNKAIHDQRELIAITRNAAELQFQQMALRLAHMQAHMMRLNALGDRVTTLAGLSSHEFNFSESPSIGEPEQAGEAAYQKPVFLQKMASLEQTLDSRERQLEIVKDLIVKNKFSTPSDWIASPVGGASWVSSPYGIRHDPFTGKIAFHRGVDISGEPGAAIRAVAQGVVTFAGRKSSYGLIVEISHSNGYQTRYAHCRQLHVKVGDHVHRAQVIAQLGSSGRSTGVHVHYEVLKDGVYLNPSRYLSKSRG